MLEDAAEVPSPEATPPQELLPTPLLDDRLITRVIKYVKGVVSLFNKHFSNRYSLPKVKTLRK